MQLLKLEIGQCYVNDVSPTLLMDQPYQIDHTRRYYMFDVVPMGYVRMTRSDRWRTNPNHPDPNQRQREVVRRYFYFRDTLRLQAKHMNFNLKDILEAVFVVPMPQSWSKKKQEKMNRHPCRVRPDVDNYTKAFMDALVKDDGYVYRLNVVKIYGYKPFIIVYD